MKASCLQIELTTAKDTHLEELGDDWKIIIDFGDIRPGESVFSGSPLWCGSLKSQVARLDGDLIGENIRKPIRITLGIEFETMRKPMTVEDVESSKRAHLEALGVDEA